MNAPARVLVVDDSPTMRGLISAVLKADPDVEVVGYGSTGSVIDPASYADRHWKTRRPVFPSG